VIRPPTLSVASAKKQECLLGDPIVAGQPESTTPDSPANVIRCTAEGRALKPRTVVKPLKLTFSLSPLPFDPPTVARLPAPK
jgi:hypothetical protein